ncbi:hypothetical protein NPJ88_013460 [Halomonas elongata]|uniref:hypothetical protein n=1 Tax=Halomonas elongata TaxID=2746 RepID=UPI00255ABF3E|nr:hypothetical protein [Halomonas elongata]MDL4863345.1 hypothetical protein [Halomonas elongata]
MRARRITKVRWKITTQDSREPISSNSITAWTTPLAFMIRWGMDMASFTGILVGLG